MDVNGDGICNTDDVVTEGVTTSVDIWLDTNHNAAAAPHVQRRRIPARYFGYSVIIHAGGAGSASYSAGRTR